MFADRVLSGMRPTGRMHIGHYHGALKNWLRLQEEHECLYFAADWHALTLLLGMIAPVGWLERVPTYKDQQEKLSDRDLSTFGFLGYPVMQAADILIYRA